MRDAAEGGVVRLWVAQEDYERSGLVAGRTIQATGPDQRPEHLVVTGVRQVPPFVWVELTPVRALRGDRAA